MSVWLLTVAALCAFPQDAAAQSASDGSAPVAVTAPSRSVTIHPDAPPEPIAPEVMTRNPEGRATVRAVRVSQPLRIDGALDEILYRDVRSISDFIQVEPDGGQAATERTETWIAFDDDYVYVSFKVWDSRMDTLIATEMRRDSTNSWQGNDLVSFIFDTFYDQRTSFTFTMNPLGGRSDGTMVNDRQYSSDWNPVWEMKSGPLRRRLGGRSRRAVQVVALSARHRAGVGVQRDAREALEERDLDVDARAAGARTVWIPAGAIRGHARGDRGAARRSQPGHQAVRDLESDDGPRRDAADLEPSRGRGRSRREICASRRDWWPT